MFNMNKITIIGTGSVGATIAYTLNTMGIASEIVLIDINTEKALGEALDIRQGNSFFGGNCSIYTVVQRCIMFKDIDQKLAGDDAVHLDPGPLDLRKGSFPLNNDQRSRLYLSHLISSPDDLVDSLVRIALRSSHIL